MSDKKFYDIILYILFYLVLFFLAADLSSQMVLKSELVTLPDLRGKSLSEARTDLAKKKTGLIVQGAQFDNRYEKGKIIFQEPSAGSRFKVNRTVKVILSQGTEKVPIPKLEGKSLEWASQTLRDVGLRRGRVSQIHTPQFAAGRIISQQPAATEIVGRGTPVNFLVSQGAWEEKYIMPDLIEKNSAAVIEKLKTMEFKVTIDHATLYPGRGPGIILRQSPIRGFPLLKRNLISLEVSK
jgi:eukaryotic-like serine/threonine-protein kinase